MNENQIDIIEFIKAIWQSKKIVLGITTIFAIFSIIYALSQPNVYTSKAILTLSNSSDNSVSLSSRYSGLAAMAGINLPSNLDQNKSALVIEIIKSRDFLELLIETPDVLQSLMAAKEYIPSTGELVINQKIFDSKRNLWVRSVKKPLNPKPSYLEVHLKYLDSLLVEKNKNTGFIEVSFKHISPVFAGQFLNLIISELNKIKRMEDLEEANSSLAYLRKQLSATNLVEIRSSITSLIQTQLEVTMMADIRKDYFVKAIEPPFIPELKSAPNRPVICIIITSIGFLLSLIFVVIRHLMAKL